MGEKPGAVHSKQIENRQKARRMSRRRGLRLVDGGK